MINWKICWTLLETFSLMPISISRLHVCTAQWPFKSYLGCVYVFEGSHLYSFCASQALRIRPSLSQTDRQTERQTERRKSWSTILMGIEKMNASN